MKMRHIVLFGLLMAIALMPAVMAQGSAQRQSTASENGAALLAEVRALRAELAEVAGVSLRAQFLVARVQLQEQRIMYLDRRRAELGADLAAAAEHNRETIARVEDLERTIDSIRGNPNFGPDSMTEEERAQYRQELDSQLRAARAGLGAALEQEQRLRTEEMDVANGLAAEQARWSDFNARLDALERALPGR